MSALLVTGSVPELRSRLTAVLDELAVVSLDDCADAEILQLWRELERSRRRLDPVEQRVIGQVQVRSLAFVHGCKTTVDFARHLLTIGPGEARGRIAAAEASGERRGPIYPTLAAALASGEVSLRAGADDHPHGGAAAARGAGRARPGGRV